MHPATSFPTTFPPDSWQLQRTHWTRWCHYCRGRLVNKGLIFHPWIDRLRRTCWLRPETLTFLDCRCGPCLVCWILVKSHLFPSSTPIAEKWRKRLLSWDWNRSWTGWDSWMPTWRQPSTSWYPFLWLALTICDWVPPWPTFYGLGPSSIASLQNLWRHPTHYSIRHYWSCTGHLWHSPWSAFRFGLRTVVFPTAGYKLLRPRTKDHTFHHTTCWGLQEQYNMACQQDPVTCHPWRTRGTPRNRWA